MNLLLFGKRGAQLAELAGALKPLNPTSVRLADNWPALEAGVKAARPDIVILCVSQLIEAGSNLAAKAQIFLIESGVPAIAAIHVGVASERIVAEEYFSADAIVQSPYDFESIRTSIELAIEKGQRDTQTYGISFDDEWKSISSLAALRQKRVGVDDLRSFVKALSQRESSPTEPPREPTDLSASPSAETRPTDEAYRSAELREEEVEPSPSEGTKKSVSMGFEPLQLDLPEFEELILDEEVDQEAPDFIEMVLDEGELPSSIDGSAAFVQVDVEEYRSQEVGTYDEARQSEGADAFGDTEGFHLVASDAFPEPVAPEDERAIERLEAERKVLRKKAESLGDSLGAIYFRHAAIDNGTKPIEYTPVFPSLTKGQIEQASPLRVLYGHSKRRSTGRLVLTRGNQQRELAFVEGNPGMLDMATDEASKNKDLIASLLWQSGFYSFYQEPIAHERFTSLGDALVLVHEAVFRGITFNEVSETLTPFLRSYPVLTSRILDDSGHLVRFDGLVDFLGRCESRTLEMIVSERPTQAESVMKNALFCYLIDAIVMMGETRYQPIILKYDFSEERSGDDETIEGESRDVDEEISAEEEVVLVELAARATEFQNRTAYEIFGLKPGCGREVVEDVYYRLVKDHHPDAYALARSPSVKPLAEMVFRQIREAFRELMSQEKTRPLSAGIRRKTAKPIAVGPSEQPSADRNVSGGSTTPSREEFEKRASTSRSVHSPQTDMPTPASTSDASPLPATFRREADRVERSGLKEPIERAAPGSRTRRDSEFSGRPISSTSGFKAIRATVMESREIQLPPRQHFKNGLSLLTSGAIQKASEAFRLACEGEKNNGTYLAYYLWSSYLVDRISKREALARLTEALDELEEKEHLALFLGKILMAAGQQSKAIRYLNLCLEYNRQNIEAAREIRLYNMRQGKRGEGLLNKWFSKRLTKGRKKR